ncbi:hypothetical protein K439DRAFT_754832 [Ramaria rubella]|nr:hypothetical protein K439DRAFT_754832 [Ramaria rubella]
MLPRHSLRYVRTSIKYSGEFRLISQLKSYPKPIANHTIMSTPTFLYKIIPASSPPPDPLPEVLPLSPLDTTSGFIHLSTAEQIPKTLQLFFTDDTLVYILRIPYGRIEKDIVWEDATAAVRGQYGVDGVYPHLYNGGRLGNAEVESIQNWERKSGGWDDVTEAAKAWLL